MSEEEKVLVTKEAKLEAIAAASSTEELDSLWEGWEARGWSREGLLYAALLARKAELGHELTEADSGILNLAAEKAKTGAARKRITGQRG